VEFHRGDNCFSGFGIIIRRKVDGCWLIFYNVIIKHIALRSRSVRNPDKPYTCPGLGDRIHACTTAWAYGQAHDTAVTLHLTADKWTGGQFGNKPESWDEVASLFPEGSVFLCVHKDIHNPTDSRWIDHLHSIGIDAELYWYRDHPGQHESIVPLDISPFLAQIPKLYAEPQSVELPDGPYITVQWDSNERKRTISKEQRERVIARYMAEGYTPVVVGGEATIKGLGWILKKIAYAMSKASLHVGVDSAFMHMAMLYMPMHRIHLYNIEDNSAHQTSPLRLRNAAINPTIAPARNCMVNNPHIGAVIAHHDHAISPVSFRPMNIKPSHSKKASTFILQCLNHRLPAFLGCAAREIQNPFPLMLTPLDTVLLHKLIQILFRSLFFCRDTLCRAIGGFLRCYLRYRR